jgi:vesicle-associated membrane protein 7
MSENDYKRFDTNEIRKSIDEIKTVMVDNVSKLFERGEKIDVIIDKTDDLNTESIIFKKKSNTLKKKMKYKNIILGTILVVLLIIIGLVIFFALCNFDFSNCKK